METLVLVLVDVEAACCRTDPGLSEHGDVALRHKITRGSLADFSAVMLTLVDAWTNFCHVVKVYIPGVSGFRLLDLLRGALRI